jgi:hypothetical protein
MDGSKQLSGIKWFSDERSSPFCDCRLLCFFVVMTGDEDDWQLRAFDPDAPLQVETAHAWHSDICDQTARFLKTCLQKILRERKHTCCETGRLDETFQRFANSKIIIDDGNYRPCRLID